VKKSKLLKKKETQTMETQKWVPMSTHKRFRYLSQSENQALVKDLKSLFHKLWPLNRSITGEEYRKSLSIISEWMPIERIRIPSGTKVFDWVVPEEWNIRDAYFRGPSGKIFADIKENNLHIIGYSQPFCGNLPLPELKKHLHSRPDMPEAIPYITSYYEKRWGFCLKHADIEKMEEGDYEVFIDSEFTSGAVEIGETTIKGRSKKTLLISSYLCHPSMANNELSGPLTLACLYRILKNRLKNKPLLTLKLVIHPETIGALCYLWHRKEYLLRNTVGGCVVSCVGLRSSLNLKSARRSGSDFERVMRLLILEQSGTLHPYSPIGSDERQYGSPGFNLPINLLSRSNGFNFPEYHTSLDNENIIDFANIVKTAETIYQGIVFSVNNQILKNTVMYGEPFLSKYGLYPSLSKGNARDIGLAQEQSAYIWLLNLCDGSRDLISVAEESMIPLSVVFSASDDLIAVGLLKRIDF
jgi:aminopeptidase-like protein